MPTQTRQTLLAPTFALALFLLLPTLTHAATPSEINYGEPSDLESIPIEKAPKPKPPTKDHSGRPTPKRDESTAQTTDEKTGRTTTEPEGESQSKEHHKADGTVPGEAGNRPPGGGGRPDAGTSPAHSVRPEPAPGKLSASVVPAESTGGGSSPVAPILIAVAVLAAASIGFALYRERKIST